MSDMVVFKIYSRGINKRTGKVGYRTEFIDTTKNALFRTVRRNPNSANVAAAFEAFWSLGEYSPERVVVDYVERVNVKSRGANWGIKMLK